jgi:hypothetical protein
MLRYFRTHYVAEATYSEARSPSLGQKAAKKATGLQLPGPTLISRHQSNRIRAKLNKIGQGERCDMKTGIIAAAGLTLGLAFSGAANAQTTAKPPNIVVIMSDDIGMWNIGAYHRGLMAGRTPNLDKIAKEGMLFTDYYAEASCTAGRANFITGELPIRTGMTTVGQAGAPTGLPAEAVTIATVLKSMGYATGQFGKNHLCDKNEFLPTVHGFDEFRLSISSGCDGRPRTPELPAEPVGRRRPP